jgi:hypothetical protein
LKNGASANLQPSGKSEIFGAKRYKKLTLQQKEDKPKPMYHIYDIIDDAQTKGLLKLIEQRSPPI